MTDFLRALWSRGSIVVVAGPPCSGKSTFARIHSLPGDQVLDWDSHFAGYTGLALYDQPPDLAREVGREFERRMRELTQGWIVRSAADPEKRALLRRRFNARAIVLAVPAAVCLERLNTADRAMPAKIRGAGWIASWWAAYVPDYGAGDRETTLRDFALAGTYA